MCTCVCVLISLHCCVLMLRLVGAGSVNINYINESVISAAVMRRNAHTHAHTYTNTHICIHRANRERAACGCLLWFCKARLLRVHRSETGKWLVDEMRSERVGFFFLSFFLKISWLCAVLRSGRTKQETKGEQTHNSHFPPVHQSGIVSPMEEYVWFLGCTSSSPLKLNLFFFFSLSQPLPPPHPCLPSCVSSPRLFHPHSCGVKPAI